MQKNQITDTAPAGRTARRREAALNLAHRLLVLLLLGLLGGCAYYNTLFNAKNSYNEGLEVLRENPDQQRLPASAKNHFETTIEKCWKLIDIYSDQSKYADDALLYIAKSEFHIEKYAQAKQHLDQFLKKYPGSDLLPEAQLWYGKVLLKEEDVKKANEYFRLVINNGKSGQIRSQASFELGLYAFEKQNYQQAINYLETALKEKLEDQYKAEVLFYLGESYYIQKDYKNAIEQYKKVEKFSPTLDIEYKAKLHHAKSYTELEKFEDAYQILRKMLTAPRFDPFTSAIKTVMAENYQREGRLEDAMDLYYEVVKERRSDAGTAQAAFDLGKIYETHYQNLDSAVHYYGKVKQLYNQFDSVEVAENKRAYLSEFKEIRDNLRNDKKLIFRLQNDPEFRDSLYQAQYEDSLREAGVLPPEKESSAPDSVFTTAFPGDSLQTSRQDSLGQENDPVGTQTPPGQKEDDSQQQRDGDQQRQDDFTGFRGARLESQDQNNRSGKNERETDDPQKLAKKPPKPLEKRKLPEIEFDLMRERFRLAEFYLLKHQDYDSAAYLYHQFLETYEDSILTPKALYSLIFIYRSPEHQDLARVYELEKQLLTNYIDSPFAEEILKNKGMYEEKEPQLTPQESARQRFMKAESLYFAGQYNDALDIYQGVAGLDTSWEISAKAQYAVAWAYEHGLGKNEAALNAYKTLINRYPTATPYVTAARRKTTPPAPESAAPDTSALTQSDAPDVALEEQEEGAGGREESAFAEKPGLNTEDVLEDKIRWRKRRDR